MADLAVWQRTIVDEEGNVIPGAEVEVRREEDGSLATLYADRAGETPLANPLAADMSGFVRFFAQGDAYTITAVGAGSTRTWRFDPTGRLQEFDRVSEALGMADGADTLETRRQLGEFATVADVESANIPPVLDSIRTNGYYTPGDGGGALYKRVATEPGHAGKIQSADGAWWAISEGLQNNRQYGDEDRLTYGRTRFEGFVINEDPVPDASNIFFVRHSVSGEEPGASVTASVNRYVNGDHESNGGKALKVKTVVNADVPISEWAISGELDSYSSVSNGYTAVSGVVNKYARGQCFAGHFQVQNRISGPSSVSGSMIGQEINLVAVDADDAETRFGIDLIAKTSPTLFDGTNAGRYRAGLRIRNTRNPEGGTWESGLLVTDNGSPTKMPKAIEVRTAGDYGLDITGNVDIGIRLAGNFGTAAIQMNAGRKITFEGTNTIGLSYFDSALQFTSGSVKKIGMSLTGTPYVTVLEQRVLGPRKTGWQGPSGTANRSTFNTATVTLEGLAERVKALIDDLHAGTGGHGLIGS